LDDMTEADARAPPPRSKTPSSLPPAARGKATPAASRQNSVKPPPSRAGAKTPSATMRRAPTAAASNTSSKLVSPTKIPARAPLSPMKTGNNSPERRVPQYTGSYDTATLRKPPGPAARAPPPKMRDLFQPPEPNPGHGSNDAENWRCASAASVDSGPIHQVPPEDVYDDREHMSYAPPSYPSHLNQPAAPQWGRPDPYNMAHNSMQPPPRPMPSSYSSSSGASQSRVVSDNSSASQAVSGSENWETYDDGSEPEVDASAAYYAKLKAARGKRATPEGGYGHYPSPRQAKNAKLRSVYEQPGRAQTYIEENGRMVPAGSDAGWTDEDAF
jgi:protein regulator of cytokinesis 1